MAILMICTLFACATLLANATLAAAQDNLRPIGLVKTASGEAYILRNGRRMAAFPGYQLVLSDVLSTGATGALGVILRDDTLLSLGAETEIRLEQFVFEPLEQRLAMVLRVTRGLIAYVSGKISRLAPGSVRIETPVATLGIRGTHLVARIIP